jgi:hypothetical protein
MSRTTLVLLALALAAGGCSTAEVRSVGVHPLKNAEGHVIGQKEVLRGNGETMARLSLYIPRVENGRLVGYEERMPGGTILRNLQGRKIGSRYVDLRSRGSNPHNRGLTIIVRSSASEPFSAPDIEELRSLAQLERHSL